MGISIPHSPLHLFRLTIFTLTLQNSDGHGVTLRALAKLDVHKNNKKPNPHFLSCPISNHVGLQIHNDEPPLSHHPLRNSSTYSILLGCPTRSFDVDIRRQSKCNHCRGPATTRRSSVLFICFSLQVHAAAAFEDDSTCNLLRGN